VKKLIYGFLGVLILSCTGVNAQNAPAASAAGDAEKGKQAFMADGCWSCHGYDGHGGAGPKLAPRPLPAATFIAIVRHPPASGMPTYTSKMLSDAQLTDILAYLKTIPEPPAVKSIAILNQ
jgi:mono/diheme cytochrome c family protein